MSDALERIRARVAARVAEAEAKTKQESVVKQNVLSNKLRLNPSNKAKVAVAEQEALAAQKEEMSKTFELPQSIYKIEGLDPDRLGNNLLYLQESLDNNDPMLKGYLKEILLNLRQYPDLAFLLTDDQIGLIAKGTLKQGNVEIAVTQAKKRAPKQTTDLDLSSADLSKITF